MKSLLSFCALLCLVGIACQALSPGAPQAIPSGIPATTSTSQAAPGETPIPQTSLTQIATLDIPTTAPKPTLRPTSTNDRPATSLSKWDLWLDGPHLRGANVYQRHVYPELDGPTYLGPGPLGPPFTQADFNQLASLGANYINLSHPGLFAEKPPYELDQAVQDNLDRLLAMAEQADLFAVISFRTGPGRSEFTFFWGEDGDWFTKDYYNDSVWKDPEAQDAWVEMWRYTAERYKDNPVVVGYDLMVEPNSNEVWFDEWDQEAFYARHGGSSYDWNPLARRISQAIRQVDEQTPILAGGNSYSSLDWLPYLQDTGQPRTVYTFHQYEPHAYTHQEPGTPGFTYPGHFDTNWDEVPDDFDRDWLEQYLSTAQEFSVTHNAPVAANEFGVMRWAPSAADYLHDLMDIFEAIQLNYAIWEWNTTWPEHAADNDAFNYLHGPDPSHHAALENDLVQILRSFWERNQYRPSNVEFVPAP
ncbi:MAG: cellulase family glycosylhydrolase [Chloroflexota bacterium]